MRGLMMDRPLLIKQLLWRGEPVFGDKEVVTRRQGGYHRYTYAEFGLRARQLTQALQAIGVEAGDRVGTLAWNTHRHYEAYFGVPCMGAVLHTINLRLLSAQSAQIGYVINHAGDKVLVLDADQIPASRMTQKWPVRQTSSTVRQLSVDISHRDAGWLIPLLFTTTSSWPNSLTARATTAVTAASSVASSGSPTVGRPCSRAMSSATLHVRSACLSDTITAAPAAAKARAVA